ncbi:MAG: hypothetical protein ACJ74R_04490 [Gaiellaceae bacterium]
MKRILIAVAVLVAAAVPAAQAAQPAPKNITIGATPTTIKFGNSATLSGKLTGANNGNRPVTIREDPFPFDTFAPAGTTTTNTSGEWTFGVKPTANTRYQARSGNADSKTVDVLVRPAIRLRLSDRTPAKGQLVRFFGRLCPEHDGLHVALQRRFGQQWRTLRKPELKDIPGSTCSKYSKRLRVRRDGRYRTRFLGDADHTAGNSRVRVARIP